MMAFPVVELRKYRIKPRRRDELIELFEEQFIESQETCGMAPLGHFRDVDDADAFIWLRGFPSYESRAAALTAFYIDSKAWQTHRDAANDTMIDSDDVLLLRPARPHSGFDLRGMRRPPIGARDEDRGAVWLSVMLLRAPASNIMIERFESVLPSLTQRSRSISYFVTEPRPNNFPKLAVREGEHAFVACGVCDTLDDVQTCTSIVDERFIEAGAEDLRYVEHSRLRPAPRSLLG